MGQPRHLVDRFAETYGATGSFTGDHAVYWGDDALAIDPNTVIAADAGWMLSRALAISNSPTPRPSGCALSRRSDRSSLRKFKTMLKRAGIGKYTLHARRSCITNGARKGLPIHVTQQLAGHADIKMTQKFYLSVQDDDLRAARRAQQQIVKGLSTVAVGQPTDQKLTNSAPKRGFPKRKVFRDGTQLPGREGT